MVGMQPYRVNEFLKLSLEALNLDYVDAYLMEFPFGFQYINECLMVPTGDDGKVILDTKTHLESLWNALEQEVRKGRAHSIGLANCNLEQLVRITNSAEIQPAIVHVSDFRFNAERKVMFVC